MEQNEKYIKLLKKLHAIKEQVGYMKKDAKSYNYSYTSGTAILAQINPMMIEHKLLLVTSIDESVCRDAIAIVKGKEKHEYAFDLKLTMTWLDIETGFSYSVPWSGSGQNSGEKGFGSALTYAERYFLLKFFQIATDDDDPDAYERNYQQAKGQSTRATKKIVENKEKAATKATSTPDDSRPSPDITVKKADYVKLYTDNVSLFDKVMADKMKYDPKFEANLEAIYKRLQEEIFTVKSKSTKK